MGLIDSPLYRRYETQEFFLWVCESLVSLRHSFLGSFFLDSEDFKVQVWGQSGSLVNQQGPCDLDIRVWGKKGLSKRSTCIGTESARTHLLLFSIPFHSTRVGLYTIAEHNLICSPWGSTVSKILFFFTRHCLLMPTSVAAPSKAWVCDSSLAGIAGSNPAGVVEVSLKWAVCIVRQRSLRRADYLSRGFLPRVVCLSVISKPKQWGSLSPLGAVEPWKKRKVC